MCISTSIARGVIWVYVSVLLQWQQNRNLLLNIVAKCVEPTKKCSTFSVARHYYATHVKSHCLCSQSCFVILIVSFDSYINTKNMICVCSRLGYTGWIHVLSPLSRPLKVGFGLLALHKNSQIVNSNLQLEKFPFILIN